MVDDYVDARGSIWLLHCAVYAQRQGLWFVQTMAASSTDDIPKQLATLLGMETVRIRKTDEEPPKVSVIDVAVAVTGHDANHAGQAPGDFRSLRVDTISPCRHLWVGSEKYHVLSALIGSLGSFLAGVRC